MDATGWLVVFLFMVGGILFYFIFSELHKRSIERLIVAETESEDVEEELEEDSTVTPLKSLTKEVLLKKKEEAIQIAKTCYVSGQVMMFRSPEQMTWFMKTNPAQLSQWMVVGVRIFNGFGYNYTYAVRHPGSQSYSQHNEMWLDHTALTGLMSRPEAYQAVKFIQLAKKAIANPYKHLRIDWDTGMFQTKPRILTNYTPSKDELCPYWNDRDEVELHRLTQE